MYPLTVDGTPWAAWRKQAWNAPHLRQGWSPDSLFNLERTLFAVFFMSDMSSSSSSFVSGEAEEVGVDTLGSPMPMSRPSLLHKGPMEGGSGQTWVFLPP